MKRLLSPYFLSLMFVFGNICPGFAQSMHFSQYYNAPLLLNPANTALTATSDFRLGVNHRMQWLAYPAPYTTTSAYGDFQLMRNQNETNWMGLGFAFFNDNVGDGQLNLFRSEIFLAYHIQIGSYNMISFGASGSYNSRSVNFSKFTYPLQWDGYIFDKTSSNGENKGLEKSAYTAVTGGINYAFFPNEALYMKVGLSTANLNKPVETFFSGSQNKLDFRHTINAEIQMKTSENIIINPSAYYSIQSGAREILFGSLVIFNMAKDFEQLTANQLLFGAFSRWGDAVIGVAGYQYNGMKFTASYDFTLSSLPANASKSTGALEVSFVYEGLYGETSKGRNIYHCPRF
ncbi:PorP/SprF family type IX secretion system membrane protein [Rurimicrobium arvi]